MSLPIYLLKRLLQAIPLLFIVSVISFTLLKISPIDPLARLKENPAISQATIKAEEERLGLNKPVHIQYILWLSNIIRGDLGISTSGQAVYSLLIERAGNTLLLGILTLIFTWLIALPAGIYAATHRNEWIDKVFNLITAIGMSTPTFLLALLLLVGALGTGALPIGGLTSPDYYDLNPIAKLKDLALHLVIPVSVLTFVGLAAIQRQMRGSLLETMRSEYLRTARAKGLSENKVIYKHAVRNALNPLITLLGFEFASLLSGAALTETVIAYPGLGRLTLEGVFTKDMNLIMATLMLGTLMLIAGNLCADILLKFNDPRIEFE